LESISKDSTGASLTIIVFAGPEKMSRELDILEIHM